MRKQILKWLLFLWWVLGTGLAGAQEIAPDALLKQVTSDVITILKQAKADRTSSTRTVNALVESQILPHFDFSRMTQSAAARYWREATPQQQAALTAEFGALLVNTYLKALAGYRDQAVEFKRLRMNPSDTEVVVNSIIRQGNAHPLAIDYVMAKTPAGWKVCDVRIEGVSLVAAYRDSFASKIRESGMDGLIKSLAEKNWRPA